MPFWTEWSIRHRAFGCGLKRSPRPQTPGGYHTDMPAKGHRKPEPLTRQVYVRFPDAEYVQLKSDAAARAMTISKLTRALAIAYYKRQRPELKQTRNNAAALVRELNRIGNNLNQLARAANTPKVDVPADELRQHLASLLQAIARI